MSSLIPQCLEQSVAITGLQRRFAERTQLSELTEKLRDQLFPRAQQANSLLCAVLIPPSELSKGFK